MSALDLISAASDETFAGRVMMLMFGTAQNVASEDPATPNDAERKAYASYVIMGHEKPQLVAAHVISSNASIQITIEGNPAALGSDVPDGDIEFALATIWDSRSLAYASVGAAL